MHVWIHAFRHIRQLIIDYTVSLEKLSTYDSIDEDIAALKDNIRDDRTRSHFLGGIVRLVAHDFMDFDPNNNTPMGPDGCFDTDHPNNAGLESIWCSNCELTRLHIRKYSHISKADFWIACANAVIRQTSVDNELDLKETFRWGRIDRASCRGSGERLPRPAGCEETQDVFLRRMGLEWRDAVALMGAHTLGRGDRDVSPSQFSYPVPCNIFLTAMTFVKSISYSLVFWSSWNLGRQRPRFTGVFFHQDECILEQNNYPNSMWFILVPIFQGIR